ncbi:MAG TPA: class I SAM-dependent rRNA methyltransferase [Candidatus Synoicihabitans sp.]|nr:class I SAM-dependent rRNA methyltransferase [Candidatus Synoicihabitans sp.]
MPSVAPALKLRPNAKGRVLTGHPWVFANEVETLLPPEHDGEVVECRDRAGRLLGTGIYNSRSQIVWRRLSRERVTLDAAYFDAALTAAIARRDPAQRFRRLVWSESDGLPGVVVDQFDDTLVVQLQTLAMERRADLIDDALAELLQPAEIIHRDDAPIRRLEGLPQAVRTRSGQPWAPRWVTIDGFDYWLDLQQGQKTGFYLDQREQHGRVARWAPGRRVLDAFCNQGSFALHAARAGAVRVLGLDSAEDAIAQARQNAARNAVAVEFQCVNVFDYLGAAREETWDLIVLDPPPFAKSKSALEGALRGYKEINLRAMQRLSPGGILATYTCSHHMQDAELRGVLASAAADAKRRVSVLENAHQPADHPVLVTMPESEYLRGYILRVD